MNRSLLRNLAGPALAAAALTAPGGTAAAAPACHRWHPALDVIVADHAWSSGPPADHGHAWPTATTARTTWHQAATPAARWHPDIPATGSHHAWNPAVPDPCPTPGG